MDFPGTLLFRQLQFQSRTERTGLPPLVDDALLTSSCLTARALNKDTASDCARLHPSPRNALVAFYSRHSAAAAVASLRSWHTHDFHGNERTRSARGEIPGYRRAGVTSKLARGSEDISVNYGIRAILRPHCGSSTYFTRKLRYFKRMTIILRTEYSRQVAPGEAAATGGRGVFTSALKVLPSAIVDLRGALASSISVLSVGSFACVQVDLERDNRLTSDGPEPSPLFKPATLTVSTPGTIRSDAQNTIPALSGTDGSSPDSTASTQLTTMTRDGGSDGACSSSDSAAVTALVATIRARVVEYKELLLRQLMDQRVALLAIDDVADAKAKRVVEEKPATEDAPLAEEPKAEDAEDEDEEDEEEDEEEEAMEEEDTTAVSTADVDVEMTAVEAEAEAEAETPDTVMNGHADPVATEEDDDEEAEDADRKRRASVEPVVEMPAEIKATEQPTVKESKPAEIPVVVPAPRVVKRIRRASFSTGDHPPPPVPGGRPVARSSTPPRRYLDQRDDLLDDTHLQLVLKSPSRPLKATTTKPRAASSLEDVQAEFDQKLRVTMRLQRDVNRRSVAVTRKRQLPRLPTPARSKSHWDYLLEEMRWMAMDFSQERNWKRGVQWHLAKDVVVARNAERVRREKETRQLAKEMAMQVAAFWRTMERIAARSQVRFEGGAGSAQSDRVDDKAKESEKKEDSGESAGDSSSGAEDVPVLRFKTLELESSEGAEARKTVEARLHEILSTSRRARSSLSVAAADALESEREQAIQRVLEKRSAATATVVSTSTMLATFQIVALRWMLELCLSGCNVLLNDQVGMGQSATISAFLSVLQELRVGETALEVSHPHLVIVPADELHKWCFFLREWNQSHGIIQLYNGSPTQRQRLQGEWVKKLTVPQFFSSDDVADLEKEDSTPLFAVVCSAEDFVADHPAFRALSQWRTVVVEVGREGLREEDVAFVQSLSEINHSGRRVLSCSQPLESWPSSKTRAAYAEFLVRDSEEAPCDSDAWIKGTILEKTSAVEVVRWFGNKTGSTALLKSQQDHLNALTVAVHCLSLRRLRSEVESELGKLEETSVACTLSQSQQTQYRHAITAFAASSAADRISLWLQLVLKLRSLCNCVDVLNDAEKLALADVPFLLGCSGKLQQLHELLTRVVGKEHRRVVVYCQLDAMLNVVEMLLALMDVPFVYVTGSVEMQRRALCHFALKPAVQVALVSTRLASMNGKQAMPVYGADAVVVLDSDWQATCDAKLRASWAKCVVGNLSVFRFHCDATIEAALLRSGSCFSEKVFSEMGPQELLAAGDGALKIEKPVWWTPNGVAASTLAEAMAQVEISEQYCDSTLAKTLKVVNVELDAEEHLLLANADELMPVEWYAVNYLASSSTSEKKRLEQEQRASGNDGNDGLQLTTSSPRRNMTTLEQLAVQESRRVRQEVEVASDLFYETDGIQGFSLEESGLSESMLESVLRLLRAKGMEPHYEMIRPPQPPMFTEIVESEPASTSENASPEMLFRVSYREPAPPAPPPSLILKLRTDASTAAALAAVGGADASGKPLKVKKRNKDLAGRTPGAPGSTVAASASGAGGSGVGSVAGIKRKHDAGTASGKPPKEPRLDFDGIPLPSDMAEFADDDFWGDTNLDALDSAAWDDPAVLSGILGPTLDVPPSSIGSAATATPGNGATTGQTTKKKSKAGAAAGGAGATAQGGAGRARKGSMSESNKDGGWQVQDDLVLKKLFEMYGSNWTLIAHVFNAATSVSRFVVRKRTPRQCYDRYGKIISSGSLTSSGSSALFSATASPTKDGSVKSTSSSLLKQHKLNAAAAALWTPQVLAERIGLPTNEMLLVFAARDSLPGLPPPSIVNVPSLTELSMKKKKKKQHGQSDAIATPGGPVLDDLKSIRTSFDAILQCMKRKTPPPPIPIPQASTAPVPDPTAAPSTAASPTKPSIVTPVPTSVPPPHKSHMDLVELLPRGALTPEEVIKRSKEAAAMAVQAAAAVASAGRSQEISPLASAGDVLMNAAFGSNSAAAIAARKAGANTVAGGGRTGGFAAASVTAPSKSMGMSPSAGSWGDPAAASLSRPPHAAPPLPHPTASPGLIAQPTTQQQQPVVSTSMNGVVSAASTPSSRGISAAGSPAMPVTTSALLHVLDRMPEIKHKIQAILNRTDCSEAQKVAMIARLLSNTNAINATAVAAAASGNLSAAVSATLGASSTAATPTGSAAASTAGSGPPTPAPTDLSSGFGQSLDTPIPMPASLATETSGPLPIPMPASIANATLASTTTSNAMSDAALASALADTDMTELP